MWSAKRVTAAAAALLLLTGCAAQTEQAGQTILAGAVADKVKSYETYEVQPADVVKSGSLTLNVVYTQQQQLYAPEDGLELKEILVERKEQVAAGEPIATFNRSSSQADVAEAELNLARALEARQAQMDALQEALDAASAGAGSSDGNIRLELAQINYDRAAYTWQQQINGLVQMLETAKAAFETVTLCAPYDCIVDSVSYLYDEQKVDTSTVIAEISRLSSMALTGETSTNNFQYGNRIEVEYGKKDSRKTAPGRVVSTSTLLGQDAQKVWVVLDEPMSADELVKPTAKTEIQQLRGALAIPRAAVESDNGAAYVQILVDGVAHKRYIIRGINVGTASESQVVVLSGLEAGQLVIIN